MFVFKKKIKTTVFTVLKSPHVNKTAQTQFENKLYRTQLTIYSNNYYKLIYFIKYFSENNFSDIKIKIKIIKNKNITSILDISSYFLKKNVNSNVFFKILDVLGELQFKNVVQIAQQVEQRTENPWDGSSNLSLNKNFYK